MIDNRTLYRVRIGPISDVAIADKIVQKLIQLNGSEHHIVIN